MTDDEAYDIWREDEDDRLRQQALVRELPDQNVLRLSEAVDHRIGAALHALRDVKKAFKDESHWVVLYLKTCEKFLTEADEINAWRHDVGCHVRVLVDIPPATENHQEVKRGATGYITSHSTNGVRFFQPVLERPADGWPKMPVQLLAQHYEVITRPEDPTARLEREDEEKRNAIFAGATL